MSPHRTPTSVRRRATLALLAAVIAPTAAVLRPAAGQPSFAQPADNPAAADGAKPDDRAFRKAATDRYVQYAKAVRDRVLTPASCPFSPRAVVLLVGTDPQPLADFVRRATAYEPAVGVVRGAEGTLAARAGGDWDRAVLLQALLREAGYAARLKVVKRTPDEAAAVVAAFLARPATIAAWFPASPVVPAAAPPAPGVAGAGKANSAPSVVEEFGLPQENRRLYQARATARVYRLVGESLDAAALETPHLMASVAAASTPGQPFDAWRAKLLAAAAERVEVEIDGPNGSVGLTVAPDAAAVDAARLAAAAPLAKPPVDRVATLAIRLSFTAGEEGKAVRPPVTLIDRVLPLDTTFRRPVRLEVVPSDDAAAAKPTATWTKADWYKFATGFSTFQAVLRVGDEWEGSKAFNLQGELLTVSADGRVENASQIGGAIGKGLGGGFGLGGGGDEPAAPAKAGARIESIVMTLELAVPGEPPQVQQRLIYGREQPGATPVFAVDALTTPGPIGAHAVSWMMLDAVTRNAPMAARLAASDDPRRFEQTEDAVRFPTMLYEWQTYRLMAAARLMAANPGLTLVGGPSVVLRGNHVTTSPADQGVGARRTIDVAFDRAMLVPRTADAAAAAPAANATLGVATTVLESALLRSIDPARGVKGAYATFEEARAAGAKPVAARADGAGSAVRPPPLVAWSLARNEAGRALVFPTADSPRAWWSVDPATGCAIGRGDGGEGQSAMEYLQITKKNVENLKCMVGFSNQILGGSSNYETSKQFFLCMTGTDNAGSGHGVPGGLEGGLDSDFKVIQSLDLGFGPIADALGGAKDLYEVVNGDNPILYTGR